MINICDQANYYDALTRITKRNPNYKTAVMLLQLIDENGVHYNSSKCKEEDKKLIKLYDIVSNYVQIFKEYRYI
ncbi:MAG: hypothetical protein IJ358_02080 [Clostridia bacterium]|nr:hypothetical protein [Clostridia bacterium]